ncbi:MAG: hypothetical protein HMLIMOIP_001143 [Candidatus Nitrosomirales archaeon]|jgi:hypothetical protein
MKTMNILLSSLLLVGIIALSFTPNADAGKSIKLVGTMTEEGTVRFVIQNNSSKDVFGLTITSYNCGMYDFNIPERWTGTLASVDYLVGKDLYSFNTENAPVVQKSTSDWFSFITDCEGKWLKFKWFAGYDGHTVDRGAFKVKINSSF